MTQRYQDPSGLSLIECLEAVERALRDEYLNVPQARHFVQRAKRLAADDSGTES